MAINLSFLPQELNWANKIYYENGGNWSPKIAEQVMGSNNFNKGSEIIKYCVKLRDDDLFQEAIQELSNQTVFDEAPLESLNILAKHFDRMHRKFMRGNGNFLFPGDLYQLGIHSPSVFAVFRNLEGPYEIYNQGKYTDGSDRYKVEKIGTKEIKVVTKRHPVVQKEKELESEQVKFEKDDNDSSIFHLSVKKEHVGLVKRFAIYISLKPPATHCGMTITLNSLGNKIFIYALELPNDLKFDKKLENKAGIMNNNATCMGYGFSSKELETMLIQSTNYIKKNIDTRLSIVVRPEHNFEEQIDWLVQLEDDFSNNSGEEFDFF